MWVPDKTKQKEPVNPFRLSLIFMTLILTTNFFLFALQGFYVILSSTVKLGLFFFFSRWHIRFKPLNHANNFHTVSTVFVSPLTHKSETKISPIGALPSCADAILSQSAPVSSGIEFPPINPPARGLGLGLAWLSRQSRRFTLFLIALNH